MKVKRTIKALMLSAKIKAIKNPTSMDMFAYAHVRQHYIWCFSRT